MAAIDIDVFMPCDRLAAGPEKEKPRKTRETEDCKIGDHT
jgi:hypothetical protein